MASFGRQFSSSPVLTMSPQSSLQTPLSMTNFPRQHCSRPFGSFAANSQRTANSAGRKRSRDEAAVNLDADASVPHLLEPPEGWIYGEGMTLIKPGPGYYADASSQSGTWVDEKTTISQNALIKKAEDANQRSCKTQRVYRNLDQDSTLPTSTGIAALQASVANSSHGTTSGPVVDDFTLQLGIGWRRISNEEHIQAAARGWARYIENHYPLSNVRICLESKGLQSYLVEASEGFFLFAESLREGRLVSQDVQGTLRNLQCTPPSFDGAVILTAAESPRPSEPEFAVPSVDTEMNMI